jgi:GTP-binding protein
VLDLSAELFKQANTWITTGRLNKAFEIIRTERAAPGKRGSKWPKIYYVTQVAVNPVTFMMFVNDPGLFDENYRRFMTGRLRELLPIAEVPIRLLARPKTSRAQRGEKLDHS